MIKRYFKKIKEFLLNFNLKKNNRPLIFFICLIIASILWLFNALGKRYETTISMPVQYTNLPKNKLLVDAPPASLKLKMEAYGFTLLRHKIKLTINPLNFNFRAFTNDPAGSNRQRYAIATDQFIPQFSRQVSSEINITDISPDTLYFNFDHIITVKKPVKDNFAISFQNQYFLLDSIKFEPDSVLVRGPRQVVDTIGAVLTSKQKFKELNASVRRNISLEDIKGIEIDPRRVVVDIPVSQYTEYVEKITVSKFNVPDSLHLVTLPGKIEISCLVALNDYKNLSPSSFIIGVDFNDISLEQNSLPLKLYRVPAHIKLLRYNSSDVKFIIEKKQK